MQPRNVKMLRKDGVVGCRDRLTSREALDVERWFRSRPTYNAHCKVYADGVARCLHDTLALSHVAGYDMADVVNAPHFLKFAVAHADFAAQYLGQEPLLYSVNAFFTCAADRPCKGGIQEWHRDADDTKFIALFMFGTDVIRREDGAHLYQRGTHLIADEKDLKWPHTAPPPDEVIATTGIGGEAFIVDPRGFHMGVRPEKHPRLLLWARFGVTDPATVPREAHSYNWDALAPADLIDKSIIEDERTRRLLRLVCK